MTWVNEVLETGKDVVGLIKEVHESFRPVDDRQGVRGAIGPTGMAGITGFDPRNQIPSTMMMFSSASMDFAMHDHVFRGAESVPMDVYYKRVEEFRKKHPEMSDSLEVMHEKVYGTREWETPTQKITEVVEKTEDGGVRSTTHVKFKRFKKWLLRGMDQVEMDLPEGI